MSTNTLKRVHSLVNQNFRKNIACSDFLFLKMTNVPEDFTPINVRLAAYPSGVPEFAPGF